MRATEIIRDLLDLIDGIESESPPAQGIDAELTVTAPDGDINRFKHIVDLVSTQSYSTEPQPKVADVAAVTVNAGGGVNGPKQAADLRGNSFRLYPGDRT